jgi:phage tail sheath gpL-like
LLVLEKAMKRLTSKVLVLCAICVLSGFSVAGTTASIIITGSEQYSGGVWDYGTVTVTVNGHSEYATYGQYSTPASIASAIAAKFSMDCTSPVNARAAGAVITFHLKTGGGTDLSAVSVSSTSGNPAYFPQGSFGADTSSLWSITGPQIFTLSPSSGPVGAVVTITGMNFGEARGSSTVALNGVSVTPLSWSGTTIIVSIPSGASSGNIVVTVGGVTSNSLTFSVNGAACSI